MQLTQQRFEYAKLRGVYATNDFIIIRKCQKCLQVIPIYLPDKQAVS